MSKQAKNKAPAALTGTDGQTGASETNDAPAIEAVRDRPVTIGDLLLRRGGRKPGDEWFFQYLGGSPC